MSKHIVKVAAAVAFAIAAAGTGSLAYAQASEGSIYGKVAPSAAVTITSGDSGSTRTITADANGAFNLSRLAPGKYKVSAGGKTTEVVVTIGSGTAVDLVQDLTTVTVTSGAYKPIDFSSVGSNFTISQDQVQALPVGLSANAVAVLTPTVIKGDSGLGSGNIPSFAGASVAENAYYINGFDVTNIRNFLSYADLPYEAVAQQQVKAGGYGAEYGRSLGGVISLVTKRGTNEWHGGVSTYWVPEGLKGDRHDVLDKEPTRAGKYYIFSNASSSDSMSVNAFLGGPIIKDKLFFFALVNRPQVSSDSYGETTSIHLANTSPNGLAKIDWNINDKNLLEFTGIYNKSRTDITDFTNPAGTYYPTTHLNLGKTSWVYSGGSVLMGKYTGYVTDSLTVSAQGGQVIDISGTNYKGARSQGSTCPVVIDNGTNAGCWNFSNSRVTDPFFPDDQDKRTAGRFDLEYKLGSHTIRGGVDYQKFDAIGAGSSYSGGVYYRYYTTPASGKINGVAGFTPGSQYVRELFYDSTSGRYQVINNAYYLEDSWKITPRVLVYAGLRAESFDNKNGEGKSFVKKDNLVAPRLGFSWDMDSSQPTKVFGNLGRYYIPVASNTNIRATRAERYLYSYYTYTSRDATTLTPSGLTKVGGTTVLSPGVLADVTTIADQNLQPMNQDEVMLGFQRTLESNWTVGLKAVYRKLNNGMDDYCDHTALDRWAVGQSFAATLDSYQFGCALVNPGKDMTIGLDVKGDGKYAFYTIPAKAMGLDEYTRTYQALEFTAEKPWDGKWSFRGSYVWSRSQGTGEGYVNSTIDQADAGVTQDFDYGSFDDGSKGLLPNDRTHVFKAFGNYALTDKLRLGFNGIVSSGRPLSCIGFVPPTVYDFAGSSAYTTASTYYCLNDKGVSELHQRGTFGRTPWTATLDMQLAYVSEDLTSVGKLTFQADVFNVFNSARPTELNETRDYSRGTTNAASGNQLSQNYLQPTSFQAPRSVRLSARYSF